MSIRQNLYKIVFEHDTKAGKQFDIALLWLILFSVIVVMLESIPQLGVRFADEFLVVEWVLTVLFSIEYLLRIWITHQPIRYVFSFWGIIDLLSILPTYLSLFITGYHYLLIVRIFRLLRVFRVLKLARFNAEAQVLINALKSSSYKISIFLMAVVSIVTLLGTLMYVIEGGEEGFTSIPQSIYWAIVTVTTVGYGDMVPHTVIGKFISSIAMIIGYAIIAVPTGIVTVAMTKSNTSNKNCTNCNSSITENDNFCSNCGEQLNKS
ncbi:MAG: ion transporter [Flavobacteriales bacterium]|nr:ion transporter [Flavobacteriales bacterium]MCB9173592.1 ion transporter [Flavobacteriales bacterium]